MTERDKTEGEISRGQKNLTQRQTKYLPCFYDWPYILSG